MEDEDRTDATDATEEKAREAEEQGAEEDDERIEAEATSKDRLDSAANPDEPGSGGGPYPPKPA